MLKKTDLLQGFKSDHIIICSTQSETRLIDLSEKRIFIKKIPVSIRMPIGFIRLEELKQTLKIRGNPEIDLIAKPRKLVLQVKGKSQTCKEIELTLTSLPNLPHITKWNRCADLGSIFTLKLSPEAKEELFQSVLFHSNYVCGFAGCSLHGFRMDQPLCSYPILLSNSVLKEIKNHYEEIGVNQDWIGLKNQSEEIYLKGKIIENNPYYSLLTRIHILWNQTPIRLENLSNPEIQKKIINELMKVRKEEKVKKFKSCIEIGKKITLISEENREEIGEENLSESFRVADYDLEVFLKNSSQDEIQCINKDKDWLLQKKSRFIYGIKSGVN